MIYLLNNFHTINATGSFNLSLIQTNTSSTHKSILTWLSPFARTMRSVRPRSAGHFADDVNIKQLNK